MISVNSYGFLMVPKDSFVILSNPFAFYGSPWIPIDSPDPYGFRKIPSDSYGFLRIPRIPDGFHWIYMDSYGFLWVPTCC